MLPYALTSPFAQRFAARDFVVRPWACISRGSRCLWLHMGVKFSVQLQLQHRFGVPSVKETHPLIVIIYCTFCCYWDASRRRIPYIWPVLRIFPAHARELRAYSN